MIRKVVKILWIFIALISLVCVFIFFSIAKGWIGYMPPVEDLENPNSLGYFRKRFGETNASQIFTAVKGSLADC